MSFALTSRTRFFPELAEAGYRCFETEPCDDVRVGVATLRCGPHPLSSACSAALGGAGLAARLSVLVALVAGLLAAGRRVVSLGAVIAIMTPNQRRHACHVQGDFPRRPDRQCHGALRRPPVRAITGSEPGRAWSCSVRIVPGVVEGLIPRTDDDDASTSR